jgi:hypothetical protein
MAEHTSHGGHMEAHRATYEGFLTGAFALSLICAFTLVALCSFAFGGTWNVFLGFAGLLVGAIAVAIDARMGSKRWFLSLGVLAVYGLITAVNVS